MRKWHRWLGLFSACFMLIMAATGLMIHASDILSEGQGHRSPAAGPATAARAGFVCPPDYVCRPKPKPGQAPGFPGLVKHIHSGEILGPFGTLLSILTGLALLFLSVSGIWLYVQMWRFRVERKLAPRWLWK